MGGSAVEDDAVEVEEDAVQAEESTVRLPAEGQGQAEPASLIGTTLNERYRLLEVIGDGGMGRVYRAEQLATGKAVALKLLHPEFVGVDQVVKRFEREATVMTQLSHPHIVNVIELGEWNGRLFLAMELLAGKTLAELIGDGAKGGRRQTIKWTLAIMRPMLDALEYAHERGVVHRDLKPENIMVAPGGLLSRETIKLLDFGIAKLGDRAERPASPKLTSHGLVIGTPAYMSPEQAAGLEVDVRSDIYSCGVILYQMLTGRRPFESETGIEVVLMHINDQPKSLSEVTGGAWMPDAMENVVLRAMAKRPSDRFQSARELRQALDHAAVIDYAGAGGAAVSPALLSAGSRFLCLAIIAAAVAIPLGHHLKARRAAAASKAAAVAAAAAPAPPQQSVQAAAPESAREASERSRRGAKHARTSSKRPSGHHRR